MGEVGSETTGPEVWSKVDLTLCIVRNKSRLMMFPAGKQDGPYSWVLTLFYRDPCPSKQPPKKGGLNPVM